MIVTSATLLLFLCAIAQNPAETEIQKLVNAQRNVFLKKDTAVLYKIFSPDFAANAPTNKITTLQKLKLLIQSRKVDMELFERVTEKATFVKK